MSPAKSEYSVERMDFSIGQVVTMGKESEDGNFSPDSTTTGNGPTTRSGTHNQASGTGAGVGRDTKRKAKDPRTQPSFLSNHADTIVKLNKAGLKPLAIATSLISENGLPKGAITGKQISDWLSYHKKAKKIKTLPVSAKNFCRC